MMPSSFADKAIARILDLSADLQIQRRTTAPGSPIFLNAEPAIVAYGRVLEVLSTLQQQEEYRAPRISSAPWQGLQNSTPSYNLAAARARFRQSL